MHFPEKDGFHIDLKLLARHPVIVQLDRADLDDLAAQVDGQIVKNGGLGAHRLIPLHVHDNIADDGSPLSFDFHIKAV